MKLYKIAAQGDDEDDVRWVGTQADMKTAKKEFIAKYGTDNVTAKEEDVPTDKAGLMEFLNTYKVGQPGG